MQFEHVWNINYESLPNQVWHPRVQNLVSVASICFIWTYGWFISGLFIIPLWWVAVLNGIQDNPATNWEAIFHTASTKQWIRLYSSTIQFSLSSYIIFVEVTEKSFIICVTATNLRFWYCCAFSSPAISGRIEDQLQSLNASSAKILTSGKW